jgi:hypothetical protein
VRLGVRREEPHCEHHCQGDLVDLQGFAARLCCTPALSQQIHSVGLVESYCASACCLLLLLLLLLSVAVAAMRMSCGLHLCWVSSIGSVTSHS